MADFRIRYGLAFGPFGTISTTSSLFLLPPQDTTPDVSIGTYWVTNNTSAVAYTFFDGTQQGGVVGPEEGKIIIIRFQDSNTTIVNGGRIFLAQSGGAFNSGEVIGLIHSNSAWYEMFRAENAQGAITQTSVGGTMAPNVSGVQTLLLNATAATTIISFSGGEVGQQLIVQSVSGGNAVTINTSGNLGIAGTDSLILNNSASYLFVNRGGTRWLLSRHGGTL